MELATETFRTEVPALRDFTRLLISNATNAYPIRLVTFIADRRTGGCGGHFGIQRCEMEYRGG